MPRAVYQASSVPRRLPPSLTNPPAVSVRIGKGDLARPWLVLDRRAKLPRNALDVVDVEVHQRIRSGVPLVLGEVKGVHAAPQEDVQRKASREPVFPLDEKSEPCVPASREPPILHAEDRNQFLRHGSTVPHWMVAHKETTCRDVAIQAGSTVGESADHRRDDPPTNLRTTVSRLQGGALGAQHS